MKKKIFYAEESPCQNGKYLIRGDFEALGITHTAGSFNVICARLMNLSYPSYLRMCRDCFGAEVIGKGSLYPVAYFKRSNELNALVDLLNARAQAVIWDREHPDYEQHKEYIKEKLPAFYEKVTNG